MHLHFPNKCSNFYKVNLKTLSALHSQIFLTTKSQITLQGLVEKNCIPLSMGGDHLITYPILRGIASKYGPVALIHVDAHSDTAEHQVC